jgi:hypothetical protein
MESESDFIRGHVWSAYDPDISVFKQAVPRDPTSKQVSLSLLWCNDFLPADEPKTCFVHKRMRRCCPLIPTVLKVLSSIAKASSLLWRHNVYCDWVFEDPLWPGIKQFAVYKEHILSSSELCGRREGTSLVGNVAVNCTRLYCPAPCD